MKYTKTWGGGEGEYDPETEGCWLVRFKPEASPYDDEGRRWGLGMGDTSSPQFSLNAGMARFALLLASLPDYMCDRIALYKAPCVFSVGGDVFVADHTMVSETLLEEAREAKKFHVSESNFMRKHSMSQTFM